MPKPVRISKAKGVEMCAELLHTGKKRKEILQEITNSYQISAAAVDKWIKAAGPKVRERKERAEALRAEKDAEEIEAIAKELGISKRSQLAELKKVGYMDARKLYNPDGTPKEVTELDDETAGAIAGVEIFEEIDPLTKRKIGTTRKVKKEPKLTALAEINKMMGYYPATAGIKAEIEDKKGDKVFKVTLNLS